MSELKCYTGSCHCKALTYKVDLDFSKGTLRCNCTSCFKTRAWEVHTNSTSFQFTGDHSKLANYNLSDNATDYFCQKCGVRVYGKGFHEALGGDYVIVFLTTIDNLTQAEFSELSVNYMNGREDDWENTPQYYKHL